MPTRSSPGSIATSYVATRTLNDGTSSTLSGPVYSTAKWTNSVTTGDNIPGWRDKLRQGLDATTSLTGSKVTARLTPGYLKVSQPKTAVPWATHFDVLTGSHGIDISVPTGDPSTIDSSKSDSLALGKFARRIIEVNTAFQGGIFLGELAQTLRMIKSPALGLRKLVDEWGYVARRIRGSRVYPLAFRKTKVAEALADSWLEVQFGWRPLLNDIDNGSKALALLNIAQSPATRRITAKSEVEGNSVLTTESTGVGLLKWKWYTRTVDYQMTVYRGAMRVEARDPVQMKLELLGFNPGSFLPTAWELIPYSFLIDYFTNIGDIINGWSTLATRLAWCNRTVKREFRKTVTTFSDLKFEQITWPAVNAVTFEPAKYVCAKTHVSRAKYTGTYVPGLVFEIPGMGSLRWLNIAALIAGRRSDRKWSYGD